MKHEIFSQFSLHLVHEEEIYTIIHKFPTKTSTGHGNLYMKLIKSTSSLIYKPLTIIINQSLKTGIFPDKVKIAKVLPLYKKDDDTNLNNYRPISLLPFLSIFFKNSLSASL